MTQQKKGRAERRREILLYLLFGVLTTLVSKAVQFAVLAFGEYVLGIADTEPVYHAVRGVALVLQWIAGVLFAFFTNRKFVFNAAQKGRGIFVRQLAAFTSSRLFTLGLEAAVNYGIVALCHALGYTPFFVWKIEVDADVLAVCGAAVIVVITNYFLSKFWVFRKKERPAEAGADEGTVDENAKPAGEQSENDPPA